jgi:hypothetical protein
MNLAENMSEIIGNLLDGEPEPVRFTMVLSCLRKETGIDAYVMSSFKDQVTSIQVMEMVSKQYRDDEKKKVKHEKTR